MYAIDYSLKLFLWKGVRDVLVEMCLLVRSDFSNQTGSPISV